MCYKYIYYPNGVIVLGSKDGWTRIELNILTRFLFGEGASLDRIFNCGVGAFIKFQDQPLKNKQRSLLTTKCWRYCKKNDIKITGRNFPSRSSGGIFDADFEYFLTRIKLTSL